MDLVQSDLGSKIVILMRHMAEGITILLYLWVADNKILYFGLCLIGTQKRWAKIPFFKITNLTLQNVLIDCFARTIISPYYNFEFHFSPWFSAAVVKYRILIEEQDKHLSYNSKLLFILPLLIEFFKSNISGKQFNFCRKSDQIKWFSLLYKLQTIVSLLQINWNTLILLFFVYPPNSPQCPVTYFCIVKVLRTVANFQTVQPVNVFRTAMVVKGTANTTTVSQ